MTPVPVPDEEPPVTDIWGDAYPTPTIKSLEIGIEGMRYHVERAGTGPPLVLLHGFTGSTRTWARLLPLYANDFTAIAVDLPGHGQTDSPEDLDRYRLDRFADDLAAILDQLGVGRTGMLGYSLGGRAAMRFGVRHPSRLAGLLLESASGGIMDEVERAARVAADMALADSIERDGIVAFVDRWERLPLWESQASMPAVRRAWLRAQRLANNPRGLANSLRAAGAGADPPLFDRLGAITVPTQVVVGRLDQKYLNQGVQLVTSFPFGCMKFLEHVGHAPHLEAPESFGGGSAGFFEGLVRKSGPWG